MNLFTRLVSRLDSKLLEPNKELKVSRRICLLAGSIVLYTGAFLFLSPVLGVSTNYFVLIPMFFAAALFNLPGGIISGLIALPSNLLLFLAFDDMASAPQSKLIAWIFGFITGTFLGYLSHFYKRLKTETAEHKAAKEKLNEAYNQKQLLLKESHHRIKNNLAIIHGIIELRNFESKDPELTAFLQSLLSRIRSLSVVQNLLYSLESVEDIDTSRYIEKLVENLRFSLQSPDKEIRINTGISSAKLNIDEALAIGLIINEAFTNSVKYAFEQTDYPEISIGLKDYEGKVRFTYHDNGTGIPDEVLKHKKDSLGLHIIEKLSRQLSGSMKIDGKDGTSIELTF